MSLGERKNEGKLRFGLLSWVAIRGTLAVLEFGARKYAAHNWRKGLPWVATVESMLRHIAAFLDGEDIDPESGLPHAHHIGCNAMFLQHLYETRKDLDDRYKPEAK